MSNRRTAILVDDATTVTDRGTAGSTTDADELSVSKATSLEHLRKAGAEILGGDP